MIIIKSLIIAELIERMKLQLALCKHAVNTVKVLMLVLMRFMSRRVRSATALIINVAQVAQVVVVAVVLVMLILNTVVGPMVGR